MAISELADWWDEQKRESERILNEWVDENPQWWALGIATATATAMDLGQGMVDALRLGKGVAEGGLSGYGQDALRLMVVLGPVGKGAATVGRVVQTGMIRLAVTTADVTGPCTFTAVNNAATISRGWARNIFITASDAAQALGKSLGSVAKVGSRYKMSAWIDDLLPFLRQHGVRVRELGQLGSVDDVVRAAATNDGVVVFAIEWTDAAAKLHRHSMIAVRTVTGVRFADYGGKFIASLSELASRGSNWAAQNGYRIATAGNKGSSVLFEGMELIGAMERHAKQVMQGGVVLIEAVRAIMTPSGVELAFEAVPTAVIDGPTHEPEVVKASFEAFKARKEGRPLMRLPEVTLQGRVNGPPRSDWLTGVQYRLNALGFGAGPVDGMVGPKTVGAIKGFQRTYGLVVDGIPGPKTQERLVQICGY